MVLADDANVMVAWSSGDDEDDVAVVPEKEGRDAGIDPTCSFPLRHHPTFDEWEAAIVKSMSERPDEIFDIFEKYADERRDESQGGAWLSSGMQQHQQSRDDDEQADDSTRDAERGGAIRRSRLDEYKGNYIAQLVEKLRLREVVASLTYRTILTVDSDLVVSDSPTLLKEEHDERNNQLLAKLDAAEKESHHLAEQLKEKERLHFEKVSALEEEIKHLKSELNTLLQQTVDGNTDSLSEERDADEASRMDDTQVMDDSPASSVAMGEVAIDARGTTDSEKSNSGFALELQKLESRNKELEQTAAHYQTSYEESEHRNHELETALQRERNAHSAEKQRNRKLDLLVTKAENLLEVQGGKLKKVELSQRKTRAICDFEISKRESLELLNEKLKIAIKKMTNKLKSAECSGGSIATLTSELKRKDAIIAAIKSILLDPTLKKLP